MAPISPLRFYFQAWLYPGMTAGSPLDLSPVSASVVEGKWTGLIESPSGDRRLVLRGQVIDETWIRVDSVETTLALDAPDVVGSTRFFSEWRYFDFLRSWVAARQGGLDVHGSPLQSVLLRDIRPLRGDELDPLLNTPAPDGQDPIRGPATFVSINDYQSGTKVTLDAPEPFKEKLTASHARPPAPNWLRPLGWLLAGVLIVALVWARLRRIRTT
ncbi:MAG: hypothetical protein KJZ65_02695 [Phycisphaerales bacterium]|nr:hypothetical protein [Phycisphaerales bacterium]